MKKVFKLGSTLKSDLLEIKGKFIGYSNGRYAIEASDGYIWYLDDKAELKGEN